MLLSALVLDGIVRHDIHADVNSSLTKVVCVCTESSFL
jgi:hypothetical protein